MTVRVLLHTIIRKTGRNREDKLTFEGEKLLIGRATEAGLKLEGMRVAARHAEILKTEHGQFMLASLVSTGITVNGERVESAILASGDIVKIGDYRLTVRDKDATHDLVLEIEKVQEETGYSIDKVELFRSQNFLQKTGFGIRTWSWSAVILIVLLFFVLPLIGFSIPQLGHWQRSFLPVFSDLVWDPGPLIRGHQHLGDNCEQCHRSAFLMVDNEACLDCHQNIPHHFDAKLLKLSSAHEFECVDCHVQHQGGTVAQVKFDDTCVDCHEDIKDFAANSRLEPVEHGFPDGHPQFRAKLIKNDGIKDSLIWASLDEPRAGAESVLVEESNLYFSHKVHLSPIVCRSEEQHRCKPDEKGGLKCADCHKREAAGDRMAPIKFSEHCQECHKLTFEFDTLAPEVPHGDAKLVLTKLTDYFLASALDCSAPDPVPLIPPQTRQRPGLRGLVEGPALCKPAGGPPSEPPQGRQRPGDECLADTRGECVGNACVADTDEALAVALSLDTDAPPPIRQFCKGTGAAGNMSDVYAQTRSWSEQKASEVRTSMLYQYRACGLCHVIAGNDIRPVRVSKAWLPKAGFSHDAHNAVVCSECHAAEKSESSRDVLLKGKESCGVCHGGPEASHKVASSCSSCHSFHLDKRPPFRPSPQPAARETEVSASAAPPKP